MLKIAMTHRYTPSIYYIENREEKLKKIIEAIKLKPLQSSREISDQVGIPYEDVSNLLRSIERVCLNKDIVCAKTSVDMGACGKKVFNNKVAKYSYNPEKHKAYLEKKQLKESKVHMLLKNRIMVALTKEWQTIDDINLKIPDSKKENILSAFYKLEKARLVEKSKIDGEDYTGKKCKVGVYRLKNY